MMPRARGSFFILILATQQVYCQDDFQSQIMKRLEKLEKDKQETEAEIGMLRKKYEEIVTVKQNFTFSTFLKG